MTIVVRNVGDRVDYLGCEVTLEWTESPTRRNKRVHQTWKLSDPHRGAQLEGASLR